MKRIFDILFSTVLFIFVLPILLISALLIKLDSKGPIFFFQTRLGKDRIPFNVYKFRTMTHKRREFEQQVLKTSPEVTKVGYWLRRFKIDELPQIINVLRGEMSVIGPRPCLPNVEEKFELNDNYRFMVKPGLSSLAGVNGSIYLSWEEKWAYDKYYVENQSILLDIKIIFKTMLVVIFGEDKFIVKPKNAHKK